MNFFQTLYSVALICCWVVIVVVALRVPARAKMAMDRVEMARAKIDKLKGFTESATELTAQIKEQAAEIEKELPEIVGRIDELKARISDGRSGGGPRLSIVSDRWSAGDKAFVAHVSNPEVAIIRSGNPHAAMWQQGRQCLLWASTARQASERFAARFPPSRGWMISPVDEIRLDRSRFGD